MSTTPGLQSLPNIKVAAFKKPSFGQKSNTPEMNPYILCLLLCIFLCLCICCLFLCLFFVFLFVFVFDANRRNFIHCQWQRHTTLNIVMSFFYHLPILFVFVFLFVIVFSFVFVFDANRRNLIHCQWHRHATHIIVLSLDHVFPLQLSHIWQTFLT